MTTSRTTLAYALVEQFIRVSMPTRNLKAQHLGLYAFLAHLWAAQTDNQFALNDAFVAGNLNCDERTLARLRDELCAAGIIECIVHGRDKKHGRQTRYIFNETIAEQAYKYHANNLAFFAGGQTPRDLQQDLQQKALQNLQQNLFDSSSTNTNSLSQEKKGEDAAPVLPSLPSEPTASEPAASAAEPSPVEPPVAEASAEANEEPPRARHKTPPPKLSDVILCVAEMVKRETARELTHDDAVLCETVAQKFIASWEAKNWTDAYKRDGKPYSVVPYWQNRAAGYYNACKHDVRASIVKLRSAENIAANIEKNQQQREEYYAKIREEKQQRQEQQNQQKQQSHQGQSNGAYSKNSGKSATTIERIYDAKEFARRAASNDWIMGRKPQQNGGTDYQTDPNAVVADYRVIGSAVVV